MFNTDGLQYCKELFLDMFWKKQNKGKEMEGEKETWLQSHWRPAMAWSYMIINLFDFMLAPILNWAYYYFTDPNLLITWDPITLKEGGFFHLSMMTVLGITAWTRGQEKIKQMTGETSTTTVVAPATSTAIITDNKK